MPDVIDPVELATKAPAAPKWLHPTLLAAVFAGVAYFLYQLGNEFQQIKDFSIYTTPPGIGDLLKLLATVVVIIGVAMGLNLKEAFQNILGAVGMGRDSK